MTQKKNELQSLITRPLLNRMLLGAGIGLAVILFFIAGTETQPDWPELWKVRPLIVTPLTGALGGLLFYFSSQLLPLLGIPRVLAYFLSFVGFVIVLWLGIVLGLDGTLWD